MYMASDPSTRVKVSDTFAQAAKHGMNVARTWAFSDGGYRALQTAPGLGFCGVRGEKTWDLSNFEFGEQLGRFWREKTICAMARERGQYLNNEDDFFTNPIVKDYYKNHIKAVLNRVNTITGVAYKDDPTIFAWELMNEPRCQSDLSGRPIQKSGCSTGNAEKKQNNPGYEVGTDFIANNRIPQVDFATIHLYPDQWVPGSSDGAQEEFVEKWIQAHINDSQSILRKPLVVSEFGKSSRSSGYTVEARNTYFGLIFDRVYGCARTQGPCGGALFWQVMAEGMENWSDGYEVVLEQSPTTAGVIDQQSRRISSLSQ
ncbi:UNVERIFIED_CONTAM: putative mannan endo-1,4-beta-mannosidase 9 [Sesamum calycinum]|uniref:mannan endo-1,4-beta-mannosidase n=1 Tax=Sesamum calycinum TaxID=2727403 RepID=A0AAW2SVL7_9LAMI